MAKKNLNPAHPTVIDVANYCSDFYYCLLGSVYKAYKISTEAYNKALMKLFKLPEELKSWANDILKLLSAKINKLKY